MITHNIVGMGELVMTPPKTVTIQLSEDENHRLEVEARRMNLSLDGLVKQIVWERLATLPQPRLTPKQALAKLRLFSQNLPAIDAVQISRASRDELLERGLI